MNNDIKIGVSLYSLSTQYIHEELDLEGCLKAVHRVYRMDYPDYLFFDTLAASRKHFGQSLPNHQLQTVAAACGYNLLNHHHALADAEACARIAIQIM